EVGGRRGPCRQGAGTDDGARAAAGLAGRECGRRRCARRRDLPCASHGHPRSLGREGFPRGPQVIGKLTGVIDSLNEDGLLLDVNGVGYVVHASSKTIGRLGAAGASASILVETQVREDAITLYGFADHAERDWFRLLRSVQGVGGKVALAI